MVNHSLTDSIDPHGITNNTAIRKDLTFKYKAKACNFHFVLIRMTGDVSLVQNLMAERTKLATICGGS